MGRTISREEEEQLRGGLEEALQKPLGSFCYKTISRGTNSLVFDIKYQLKGHRNEDLAVAKWFKSEPSVGFSEPVRDSFTRLDVLFNNELRNLEYLYQVIGRALIPVVRGSSKGRRLIVMERLSGRTRKTKLLDEALKVGYDGKQRELPEGVLKIFGNTIHLLSSLVGASKAKKGQLDALATYSQDAEFRDSRWADIFEERLLRMHHRTHGCDLTGLNLLQRLRSLQPYVHLFQETDNISQFDFQHGDFNTSQVLGEKIIDFELFGKYSQGKDLATLLVVSGLKNSSGVILSSQFQYLVDRYIVTVDAVRAEVESRGVLNRFTFKASSEVYHLSPNDMHQRALVVLGSEEGYAHFVSGVYFHAFNELIRLSAAYDRMEKQIGTEINGDKDYFTLVQGGLVKGLETLKERLDSDRYLAMGSQSKGKKDFFHEYYSLLRAMDLVSK